MYKIKIWDLGDTMEIQKYKHGNYGAPGKKRRPKNRDTPEDVRKINERNKARKVWRLMMVNFRPGDWHLILRYREKPTPEEAKEHLRKFLQSMYGRYKRKKIPFKYIAVTEIGKRGGVHHHLIIENHEGVQEMVRQSWKHGSDFWSRMYDSEEGFMDLAEYIVKKSTKEDVPGCSYSTSKNLIIPKPRIIRRRSREWREDPRPKRGWYIVKDSLVNGINPVTGTPYQRYIMKKIRGRDPDDG